MEMGALNSLSEVGVGLNLAFGLIGGVRERLISLLKSKFEKKLDVIKTTIQDSPAYSEGTSRHVIVTAADLQERFSRVSDSAVEFFVVVAFVVSMGLIIFLSMSAQHPTAPISDRWAWIVLALVILPLVGSSVFQGVCYAVASRSLRKIERNVSGVAGLVSNASVCPAPPEGGPVSPDKQL
jgi:hypothetical protein